MYCFNKGIWAFNFELSPDFISDRSLTNKIYAVSIYPYLSYSLYTSNKEVAFDVSLGAYLTDGLRSVKSTSTETKYFGRVTFPLYLKLGLVNSTFKKEDFKRLVISATLKDNVLYSDELMNNTGQNYLYGNAKFDFYILPFFALNATYINGQEEPIFKKTHSLSFGLTVARQ